jgi:hypothetical protein
MQGGPVFAGDDPGAAEQPHLVGDGELLRNDDLEPRSLKICSTASRFESRRVSFFQLRRETKSLRWSETGSSPSMRRLKSVTAPARSGLARPLPRSVVGMIACSICTRSASGL